MTTQVQLTVPETGPNPPEPATTTTEFVPQDNPANLQESYKQLQAEFTRKSQELAALKRGSPAQSTPPQEAQTETPAEAPAEAPADPNKKEDPAEQVAKAAGFDLTSYEQEYATSGDVSAENRAKIAEGLKGVLGDNAQSIVNQYIDGQKSVHANEKADFYSQAGGEENYGAMITFAAQTMSPAEIAAYNRAVEGNDHNARLLALSGLKARYEAKNGRLPTNTLRPGTGSNTSTGDVYESTADMTAAMKDPRYKTSESYRRQVQERIARSPNL